MPPATDMPPAPLLCPQCGRALEPEIHHTVEVLVCPEHGLWIGTGKLKEILEHVTTDLESHWGTAVKRAFRDGKHSPRGILDLILESLER